MYDEVVKICNMLEREKSRIKRITLYSVLEALYQYLTEQEKEKIKNMYSHISLDYEIPLFDDILMSDADIHVETFNKLNKKYDDLGFKCYGYPPENKISTDKLIDIVYEILNSMDPKFSDIFSEILEKNNIFLYDSSYYTGLCINNLAFDNSYILINKEIASTTDSIFVLAHEIGHACENKFLDSISYSQNLKHYSQIFVEVISSFFYLVAIDFCIKNYIYKDDAERSLNLRYNGMITNFDELNSIIREIKKGNIDYDDGEYFIPYDSGFEEEDMKFVRVNTIPTGGYIDPIIYGYGHLLGEYFLNIYKEDKKEGLKRLFNFLSNQGILNTEKMLNSINFRENDFSFLDENLSNNISYMRKRYKW